MCQIVLVEKLSHVITEGILHTGNQNISKKIKNQFNYSGFIVQNLTIKLSDRTGYKENKKLYDNYFLLI